MKKHKYISFKDILKQYGIESNVSNNRIYGNLRNSGLVRTKQVSKREILYEASSVALAFDFIAKQREYPISKYQQTAKNIICLLDPTCPWTHLELGGLCSIGLLNFESVREQNTNSKHPKKYICEESYFRLLEFYEMQLHKFHGY